MSSDGKTPENLADLQTKMSNSSESRGMAGLAQHRRSAEATERRKMIHDQHVKPGFFGQAFHNIFGRHAK
ncbi:hypothetical protein ISF_06757 [Cordyceps fumosorosea ARSEF 2679]|uniref:Uncharacterized protein n=1 Tax=Cordyceps fumosorosea (strain ARSEF 2679) TaxID=1081104 RepID=A0A167R2M5_CORFA|nr:hypothetical protein ISF_06757 [Cordyceps fumosorosea ARSEF 2679]OAA58218.1 hypothetical protein ISF_06757 [Cordyceps fumosorosea ARSEF 2679]